MEEKLAAKDKELQDARRALKLKVCLMLLEILICMSTGV